MRADRLVATLLILQARGRISAPALAAELEVSVKTARRDLEALVDRGRAGLRTAGAERGLVAARRRPDGPDRADRGRGTDAVPAGRTVGSDRARGEDRAAQARPGAAGAVPGRATAAGLGHRGRSRAVGPDAARRAGVAGRAAARGHRWCPGPADLCGSDRSRVRAGRPSTRPRPEGASLVPRGRDASGCPGVPPRPGPRRRADRRSGRPTRGLRPRRGLGGHARTDRDRDAAARPRPYGSSPID